MITKYITDVLLCYPKYFSVEYKINPWMNVGSVHLKTAQKQWETILTAYQRLGIRTHVIEQQKKLPDMVFVTDQGIIKKDTILMSNFKFSQRQYERVPFRSWYSRYGLTIKVLEPEQFFEGGDALWWKDSLFVGYGHRTSMSVIPKIKEALDCEVYPLHLVDERLYHLDTCLFFLNETTAFYYPSAFDVTSQQLLNKLISKLYPLTKEEVFSFCANSIVTDHHVLLPYGAHTFADRVKELGYTSVPIPISEFMKSGGGIHCLTQILREEYN